MKSSIRTKITLMVVIISAFISLTAWLVCNYLISGIFVWNLKENLVTAYNSCNELFNGNDNAKVSEGDLYGNIKNPGDAVVLIFDSEHEKIYTTISDENQMMDSLNAMLKSIREAGDTSNISAGNYIIRKNHDAIINADYYDLIGTLDNGYTVILRSPIARVEAMMKVISTVFIYISAGLIVFGSVLILIFSNIFSAPLKRLSHAARRMAELDFDVKIPVVTKDEIGELCRSFEEMRLRLKDNAEEKIEGEKENKTLISNIAHDLKTPITAVKGYAEGLMDGVADTPEKRDKYIRTIYNKANEMDTLLNELTLYAKIDTNRIPYNFAKINVSEYFNDCVEEIGLDLETKNIRLAYFNYVDENVLIIADPEQLRRVIHNIIGNSIKYLDKQQGFINIRIKDVGDFIQVEIEDNGRGISARDLPYIFDRFYRADASRNSATGGSGIGLSIVKKIIEDHGGKIWATSKESIGTVMYFVIRKYQEVPNE